MFGRKPKVLPKHFQQLLEEGDLAALQQVYKKCDINATNGKEGCNAFEMTPLPREFAFWLKEQGGLSVMEKINNEKAAYLYDFLDNSTFYKSPVAKADRSIMNVVFRTPSDELDAAFVKEAKENGLTELKGHRLVGGCRASIYNAMPLEGVKALVEFMKKFELANK